MKNTTISYEQKVHVDIERERENENAGTVCTQRNNSNEASSHRANITIKPWRLKYIQRKIECERN